MTIDTALDIRIVRWTRSASIENEEKEDAGYRLRPFKGHAPDGEKVEFYGSGVLNVDESMRAEDVEIYYDPAELIGGLLISPSQSEPEDNTVSTATATHGCPKVGMAEEALVKKAGDKYRSFLHDEAENITQWRHGGPPTYDSVNQLFEEGRTKEWPKGSLEEVVQNAIKSWEMELSHKTRLQDFKTINPDKFKLIVNGREGLSGEETLRIGSYNALLKSSLPQEFQYYKADEETFESSHDAFRSALPRGFAWEVLSVYSGPPVISFKFRHWGFFEGPFKGHAPTEEKVEFYGFGVLKVDESLRAEDVEVYYDPAELFGGLLKGALISPSQSEDNTVNTATATELHILDIAKLSLKWTKMNRPIQGLQIPHTLQQERKSINSVIKNDSFQRNSILGSMPRRPSSTSAKLNISVQN
ncbi:hypothetical protein NC651_003892 [Populus alba x Populus x berolinensis]|nr:hypothetical protein NC651_003892 [Populus alba x Populus x berolinensis]